MRDLTVARVHTYYVVAGTTPVLVHNCGGAHASPETAPDSDYVGRHRAADPVPDSDPGPGYAGEHRAGTAYDRIKVPLTQGAHDADAAQERFTKFSNFTSLLPEPYGTYLGAVGRTASAAYGFVRGYRKMS